jgi:hypothetical protein
MQRACDVAEQCSGFSFTHNASFGDGCLKGCDEGEYGGYGVGEADYWTLENEPSHVVSQGGLALEAANTDGAVSSPWIGGATLGGTQHEAGILDTAEWMERRRNAQAQREACEPFGCLFEGT